MNFIIYECNNVGEYNGIMHLKGQLIHGATKFFFEISWFI